MVPPLMRWTHCEKAAVRLRGGGTMEDAMGGISFWIWKGDDNGASTAVDDDGSPNRRRFPVGEVSFWVLGEESS